MSEEAKLRIAALRWSHSHEDCTDANDTCPVYDECFRLNSVLCDLRTVANLIESLSEQLEQVTRERDALQVEIDVLNEEYYAGIHTIRPAVDAIEVIRCRDCANYRSSPFGHPTIGWCKMDGKHRRQNFYCADGDRRKAKETNADVL